MLLSHLLRLRARTCTSLHNFFSTFFCIVVRVLAMRTTYVSGSFRRPGKGNDNVFLPTFFELCESDDESLCSHNGVGIQPSHAVSLQVIDDLSLTLCMHIKKTRVNDGVARVHPGARSFSPCRNRGEIFFKIFFLAEGDSPEFRRSHHPVKKCVQGSPLGSRADVFI